MELNIGTTFSAVARRMNQRPAVLAGEHAVTFGQLVERSARFGRVLQDHGFGCFAERETLLPHECGQNLMAQFLHNGPEYLEGMLGSYLARVAPFNVNHNYTVPELTYLFRDAKPTIVQYHGRFASILERALAEAPEVSLLIQVEDGTGAPLLPGAVSYEEALASVPAEVHGHPSPDDLYVLYTGGTTGMPKGVLWRQADFSVATLQLRDHHRNREWQSLHEYLAAIRSKPNRVLVCAPLMHGAAQWATLRTLCEGSTVVFLPKPESFSASEVLKAVEQHQVTVLTIVGDAFALPLAAELERRSYDTESLRVIVSGGAALHASCKGRLLELLPNIRILENIGSSESGVQGSQEVRAAGDLEMDRSFHLDSSTAVVSEDRSRFVYSGSDEIGWLAKRGRIPLGYLRDPQKTTQGFPTVDGIRVSIPGDRAQLVGEAHAKLLGRDSLVINTGGEKVFVEEIEAALKEHPDVLDAIACGRPSRRWGTEVVAIVEADTPPPDDVALRSFCRTRLARYKIPKTFYFERVRRTPAGKADYKWAQDFVRQNTVNVDETEV